jgi:hypothetical protein
VGRHQLCWCCAAGPQAPAVPASQPASQARQHHTTATKQPRAGSLARSSAAHNRCTSTSLPPCLNLASTLPPPHLHLASSTAPSCQAQLKLHASTLATAQQGGSTAAGPEALAARHPPAPRQPGQRRYCPRWCMFQHQQWAAQLALAFPITTLQHPATAAPCHKLSTTCPSTPRPITTATALLLPLGLLLLPPLQLPALGPRLPLAEASSVHARRLQLQSLRRRGRVRDGRRLRWRAAHCLEQRLV